MSARVAGVLAAGLALLAGLAPACGPDERPPAPYHADPDAGDAGAPGDAVLLVCGRPITRAELERTADALARVNPARTRRALRREAVQSVLVPREAAAGAHPEEAAAARAAVERRLARLRGDAQGEEPEPARFDGFPEALGFEPWSAACDAVPDAWVGPRLGVGEWFALRVVAREPGATPAHERLVLDLVRERFLPAGTGPLEALGACELVVLDPEVEELVPLSVRARMRATASRPGGAAAR